MTEVNLSRSFVCKNQFSDEDDNNMIILISKSVFSGFPRTLYGNANNLREKTTPRFGRIYVSNATESDRTNPAAD